MCLSPIFVFPCADLVWYLNICANIFILLIILNKYFDGGNLSLYHTDSPDCLDTLLSKEGAHSERPAASETNGKLTGKSQRNCLVPVVTRHWETEDLG